MPLSDEAILGLNRGFPMPVADPTARRDLQTKAAITGLQQAGADRRKAAAVAGSLRQAALLDNRVLAPEEIQPGAKFSAGTTADASLRQGLANALVGAQAADYSRSAGISPKQIVGPEGELVDPTFKLGGIADLDFISGGPTKGESAAKAAALVESKLQDSTEVEMLKIHGVTLGLQKIKEKRLKEEKGRLKGPPSGEAGKRAREVLDATRAERMRTSVQSKHPNSLVENPRIKNGILYIDIDGVETEVRSTRNK
jgi:hypothetical protein